MGFFDKKAEAKQVKHLWGSTEFVCSRCGYSSNRSFTKCPGCSSAISKTRTERYPLSDISVIDLFCDDD